MEDLAGYRGRALKLLGEAGARIGDVLESKTDWGVVVGTLVPRYGGGDDEHLVLKLKSGYNVGLSVATLKGVVVKAKGEMPTFLPPTPPRPKAGLHRVLVVGTGGTIASRVDYRTGAVGPAISAADLNSLIPELSDIARIEPEILLNILSENMEPTHWTSLAKRVARAVREGCSGVVVTHGTDTLGYTAAALSFALRGVPIPVVLVGAQRSSDRPSSDATQNLLAGVSVAASAPFSGVYVAMHLGESDDSVAIHRGTRVRKNHTSRRDAFVSVDVPLAAVWRQGRLESVADSLPLRGDGAAFRPKAKFDGRVALLKFHPSMDASLVRAAKRAGARALVIEGTGLGHVSTKVTAALRTFVSRGGLAFMTSQCGRGRVDLNVYDTGRLLTKAGVTPLGDMLPETALVKAMWALGNSRTPKEAAGLMAVDIAGETTARRFPV